MSKVARETTWKGARIEPGSTRRNGVQLYRPTFEGVYHKQSRWFLWNRRMLCGLKHDGPPNDCVRINRADLESWSVCEACLAHKEF